MLCFILASSSLQPVCSLCTKKRTCLTMLQCSGSRSACATALSCWHLSAMQHAVMRHYFLIAQALSELQRQLQQEKEHSHALQQVLQAERAAAKSAALSVNSQLQRSLLGSQGPAGRPCLMQHPLSDLTAGHTSRPLPGAEGILKESTLSL